MNIDKKDEKQLRDDKIAPISSVKECVVELKKFSQDAIIKTTANHIIENLINLKSLILLKPLLDKLPVKEQKELENKINEAANMLTKTLSNLLLDPKLAHHKKENKLFGDVLYNTSLAVAKLYPRNLIDPFTQDVPQQALYTSDRYVFEVSSLIQWVQTPHAFYNSKTKDNEKTRFLNPLNGSPFQDLDIEVIKKLAIKYNPNFLKESNSGPQAMPTLLEVTAMGYGTIEEYAAESKRAAALESKQNRSAQLEPWPGSSIIEPLLSQSQRNEISITWHGPTSSIGLSSNSIHNFFNGHSSDEKPSASDKTRSYDTALEILAENSLVTEVNINLLNQHLIHIEEINFGLQRLSFERILNQVNFSLIMLNPSQSLSLALILDFMNGASILNPANRQLLIQNIRNANEIRRAISNSPVNLNQAEFSDIIHNANRAQSSSPTF